MRSCSPGRSAQTASDSAPDSPGPAPAPASRCRNSGRPDAAPDNVQKFPSEFAVIPVKPVIVAIPPKKEEILAVEPVCPDIAEPRKFGSSETVIVDDCVNEPAISRA